MAITFDHEDEAYLDRLESHAHGYVVNAFRNLDPGLHLQERDAPCD